MNRMQRALLAIAAVLGGAGCAASRPAPVLPPVPPPAPISARPLTPTGQPASCWVSGVAALTPGSYAIDVCHHVAPPPALHESPRTRLRTDPASKGHRLR